MTERLNSSVAFHPGEHLNDLLTDTLHQTRSELKQLTHLTRQKWGRRALQFQAQDTASISSGSEVPTPASRRHQSRIQFRSSTSTLPILTQRNTIKIPRKINDRRKRSTEVSDSQSGDAGESGEDDLFDENGDFRRTDSKSQVKGLNDSIIDDETKSKRPKRGENRSRLIDIASIQEAAQNVKSQRDYELLNQLIEALKEREQQQKKKAHTKSQFTDVYDRTKQLLEELWEEMQEPEAEREKFGRLAFSAKTIGNCVLIFAEFSRLCSIRSLQHQVLTKIEEREILMKRLQKLDANSRNGTSLAILEEVVTVIASLRESSVELVENLQRWRNAHKTPKLFSWNNENYMMKIKSDTSWLKMSSFTQYFPFPLEDNPLLLLNHCRCDIVRKRLAEKPVYNKTRLTFNGKMLDDSTTPKTPSTQFSLLASSNKIDNDPRKISSLLLAPFVNLSKEAVERYQAADRILEDEQSYNHKLENYQLRFRAACKIQGVVRTMLAMKESREKRKQKEMQDLHRRMMLARMEYEQQQRKEASRQLKRNSITQLISQLDDDTTFIVPSNLVKKIPSGKVDEPNFDVKESFFEDSFLEYHKNGRYKAKIIIPE